VDWDGKTLALVAMAYSAVFGFTYGLIALLAEPWVIWGWVVVMIALVIVIVLVKEPFIRAARWVLAGPGWARRRI